MKLISAVTIKGFRSIRSVELEGLDDFTAFAGLNNSGKSNILRAVNAFFHNQTDEGVALDVDRDYFRPDLKKKKAKQISVSVKFSLPDQFKFRKGLEAVSSLLGGSEFTIGKVWDRTQALPTYFLGEKELNLDERQRIDQFLQMISFRYIPNRVLPIEVIRKEHQALRDVLVRRLSRKAKEHQATFAAIRETSESMIQSLAQHLTAASSDIGGVRLATPTSWADMVFAFGYRLGQGDIEIDDTGQGSGIQSLLMLETLYLIDRDYFQKFGWKQAAIWAIEEPESSLHRSLEAWVASYLASIALDPASRLQILCTTHSDLMLQYAGKAGLVEKAGSETRCELGEKPQDVLEQFSRAGISHWAHPILHFPLDPLILVEGKYDAAFIEESFKFIRPSRRVRVTYLEQLDSSGGTTGGVDALFTYIKAAVKAIKARQKDAPVVVVLDWDAAKKANQFTKLFSADDPFKVLVWPDTAFNPATNRFFRGIERHFSDELLKEAEDRGAPITQTAKGEWVLTEDDYGKVKEILYQIIVSRGLTKSDLVHAEAFIGDILKAAGAGA